MNVLNKVEIFLISDGIAADTLVDTISQQFPAKIKPPHRVRLAYYDTFDWALYNSGLSLSRLSKEYSLRSLQDDLVLQTIHWNSNSIPIFLEAFSENIVNGKLKRILAIRSLFLRGKLETEIQTMHVLDELKKTVLQVRVEKIRVRKAPTINLVVLKPIRGYRKQYRQVSKFISEIGNRCEPTEVFKLILGAVGATPGDYSSNMRVQLQPDMSAQKATVIILKRLLEIMRQNSPGISADIDTECLHDFRVAVRRTRSALGQIKNVFPDEVIKQFKRRFADLGQASNVLRDLDVYLLKKRHYEEMLPDELRSNLTPLFETLGADRDRQHREFVAVLNSGSCRSLLQNWEMFLDNSAGDSAEKPKYADRQVLELARKYSFKQFNRVITLGRSVDESTPDKELHTFRIQCKNLRYLLEFFSSLFPQAKTATLIRQLKNQQDNLGEYNDLGIQQSQLESFLLRVTTPQNNKTGTAAAIGGLIASLYQHQQNVRRKFEPTFREFSSTDSVNVYRELFG